MHIFPISSIGVKLFSGRVIRTTLVLNGTAFYSLTRAPSFRYYPLPRQGVRRVAPRPPFFFRSDHLHVDRKVGMFSHLTGIDTHSPLLVIRRTGR